MHMSAFFCLPHASVNIHHHKNNKAKKSYQCVWQDSNGAAGILKDFTCFPGKEKQGQSCQGKASRGYHGSNEPQGSAT